MVIRRYQDFDAWKLAEGFKAEVFELVLRRSLRPLDQRFRTQLIEAARSVTSNFAEGFVRCSPGEFAHYLGISLGSLAEVEESVKDGIALGCFSESDCVTIFKLGRRATVALVRLRVTQRDRARNSVWSKRRKKF